MIVNIQENHRLAGMHNVKANPVALALKELGLKEVQVNYNAMSFMHGSTGHVQSTPEPVKEWLIRWVNYLPCEDLSFEVTI
jgi:hypothetical protein